MSSHKKIAYLLMFVFIGPLVGAQLLYIFRNHFTFATLEHGILILPPIPAQNLPAFEKAFLGKWQLIYLKPQPCDLHCQNTRAPLSQIHRALGKEKNRVEYRSIAFEHFSSPKQTFSLQAGDCVLVDPAGWLVMQYSPETDPRNIVKDLRRLLSLSHAG
jgi:hypothetical protein